MGMATTKSQDTYSPQSTLSKEESTTVELLRGVVGDATTLFSKELEAIRLDIENELARAKRAAISAAIGGGITGFGLLLLMFAAAYGVADGLDMPAWGGLLVIGGLLAVIGGGLLMYGKKTAENVDISHMDSVEDAKRDARWVANKTSQVTG